MYIIPVYIWVEHELNFCEDWDERMIQDLY